jgi:hypothetical protein
VALETSKLCLVESHNLDIAKLKSDRDIAQSVANELRLQNEKLNLIIANEATKSLSITFVASSCSTNPSCEKVSPKGNEKLDGLLNAQKQHGDKTGLGYASKSKKNNKKNKNKKKKKSVPAPPPSLKKHIPSEICYDQNGNIFEEKVREVIGNAKKAMPNYNNFAGKYNPSYVLCHAHDGHVYAKFVGSSNEYFHGLFGFQRPLSLTKEDPLRNGDQKLRLDLL